MVTIQASDGSISKRCDNRTKTITKTINIKYNTIFEKY